MRLQVNLERTNETKANRYARRVRAETSERADFEHYQQRRMRAVTQSERSVTTSSLHKNKNINNNLRLQVQQNSNHTVQTLPQLKDRKVSDDMPSKPRLINRKSSIREYFSERSRAPTLHSHKSFFDNHFVDDNREILDEHQVKFISTISRYTVLSFVAFTTTIISSSSGR